MRYFDLREVEQPVCPYCNRATSLINGTVLYPHIREVATRLYWKCTPCNATVATHPGTIIPNGRMANPELRDAKRELHNVFDPLWKKDHQKNGISKLEAREKAYSWLAVELGIPLNECHIATFGLETCKRAMALCIRYAARKCKP